MHSWLISVLASHPAGGWVLAAAVNPVSGKPGVTPPETLVAVLFGGVAGLLAGLYLGTTVQWVSSLFPNSRVRGGPGWAAGGAVLGAAAGFVWRLLA